MCSINESIVYTSICLNIYSLEFSCHNLYYCLVEVDEKEQAEKEQAAAEEHVGRERSEDDTEESNKRVRKTSEEEEA